MLDIPNFRPEARYGMPTADQLLFNREYIVGYSHLFRQARWALEVIDPDNKRVEVDRVDTFRPDLRVPEQFRADLVDYEGSGYDRGHLISSADRRASHIENSETFLLSNMTPQAPLFNRGIWQRLEEAVRKLTQQYVEVYVICGPLFDIGKKITVIGQDDKNDVVIPVPHSYFKSILAEERTGRLDMWSFILPNKKSKRPPSSFLCTTREIERRAGLVLWNALQGESFEQQKNTIGKIWE